MAFKNIQIKDPLNILPNLIFYPDDGGYNRAIVNRRGSNGRTPYGTTKLSGNYGDQYYTWAISAKIISQEELDVFEDYLRFQNDRLLPDSGATKYYFLEDRFRKVPSAIVGSSKYTLIDGIESPSYGSNLQRGYAKHKVILSVENEYVKTLTGCKYSLTFSIEEVN